MLLERWRAVFSRIRVSAAGVVVAAPAGPGRRYADAVIAIITATHSVSFKKLWYKINGFSYIIACAIY